jgi:hypothetical protein
MKRRSPLRVCCLFFAGVYGVIWRAVPYTTAQRDKEKRANAEPVSGTGLSGVRTVKSDRCYVRAVVQHNLVEINKLEPALHAVKIHPRMAVPVPAEEQEIRHAVSRQRKIPRYLCRFGLLADQVGKKVCAAGEFAVKRNPSRWRSFIEEGNRMLGF